MKTNHSKYKDLFIWDAHAGIFPNPQVDLRKLKVWQNSGVNYLSINVGFDVMSWRQTLETLRGYRQWLIENEHQFILASTMAEIDQAKKEGKLAITFDIEGMNALNEDLGMLKTYHDLGVRQMLFAYNLGNEAGGGCHDKDVGLTQFGQEIVAEMNKIGMILDCSHASYQTSMDIISTSNTPVVFTHSNPCGVFKHQRNITDLQIKACAQKGGVIGVNGMGIFLGDNDISTENFLRHLCYLCDLVGAEHVGLGLDYSPKMELGVHEILAERPDYWPTNNGYDTKNIGHYSPEYFFELMEQMLNKGFHQNEIEGVFGTNFKRIAEIAWQGS